ncbi:MAG: hypothetical protein JO147_12085 [Actinobacteria bacterium]|nr:hypothetical protein [Actinomycetota bacterium]
MPIALIVAHRASNALASSALPDAPIVDEPARVARGYRARTSLAVALRRASDMVMPALECRV